MKRVALLLPMLIVAWAGAQDAKPAATTTPPGPGPHIAVEPPSFDFGTALQNKTLNKEFSLKNFGSTDLVIEGISTTCGCTTSQLETKVLKPGMSVPLRVSLETRSYSGALQRTVLIRSNDAAKGVLEVKLQVNVQPGAGSAGK